MQRAHLQYDTVSPEAVTGRLQAAQTLRGDGGLWALKARYVAATKAVPGQLRMARDAEEHAARLADTLAQANERFEALKTQENLLRALVEEARRLATTEKPANGLLASFPAGAPPPAALGSPASSRASRSPASSDWHRRGCDDRRAHTNKGSLVAVVRDVCREQQAATRDEAADNHVHQSRSIVFSRRNFNAVKRDSTHEHCVPSATPRRGGFYYTYVRAESESQRPAFFRSGARRRRKTRRRLSR